LLASFGHLGDTRGVSLTRKGFTFNPPGVINNAVEIAELAIDKGATALLMPVSSRKQLFNLPDDLATKIDIQFYLDSKEALVKSLAD
jgi:predicted ATP-dependent Lon-type protease